MAGQRPSTTIKPDGTIEVQHGTPGATPAAASPATPAAGPLAPQAAITVNKGLNNGYGTLLNPAGGPVAPVFLPTPTPTPGARPLASALNEPTGTGPLGMAPQLVESEDAFLTGVSDDPSWQEAVAEAKRRELEMQAA